MKAADSRARARIATLSCESNQNYWISRGGEGIFNVRTAFMNLSIAVTSSISSEGRARRVRLEFSLVGKDV